MGLPLGMRNDTAMPIPAMSSIVMNTGCRLPENASWIAARVDAGNLLAACADRSDDALTFPVGKIELMRSVRVVNITDAAIATPTAPPS